MEFNPINFVENLKYMGLGMLGILVVMGVIIGSIYVLGAVFGSKNKGGDGKNEEN